MGRTKIKRKARRLIEGRNPVLEALLAEADVEQIWIATNIVEDQKIERIRQLATKHQTSIKKKSRKALDKVSRTGVHQGIIAFSSPLPKFSLTQLFNKAKGKKSPCFLLLTQVFDPQNLGAILRTAEAVGVVGVIIPKRTKGVTPVVSRVAMGAAEYLPVVQDNLFMAIKILKEQGVKIVGAEPGATRTLYQADLRGPLAFVVGGEDKGLTKPIKEACGSLVSIPMRGRVPSLNMSVACAVLMYEKLRQDVVKNKD